MTKAYDSADKKIGTTYTTDKEGVIVVEGLPYGAYYFVEKTAPKGFDLDTTPIKFTIDADTTEDSTVLVNVTAKNKPTPQPETPASSKPSTSSTPTTDNGKGDSPKTGDDANWLLPILALVLGIGGLTATLVVGYRKKRKSKQ